MKGLGLSEGTTRRTLDSLQGDVRALIHSAKLRGHGAETFALDYRVHLYRLRRLRTKARRGDTVFPDPAMLRWLTSDGETGWRLIIIPMPAQPVDAGAALDSQGVAWDLGAATTAAFIGERVRTRFIATTVDVPQVESEPQLIYAYVGRLLPRRVKNEDGELD